MISRHLKFCNLCVIALLCSALTSLKACCQDRIDKNKKQPHFYSIPSLDEKKQLFRKSLITSGVLFAAGAIAFTENNFWSDHFWEETRNRNLPNFRVRVDDYIAFAPLATVYGLHLAGLKGKNNLFDQTAILLKAELMGFAIVAPLKAMTNRLRPDMNNDQSFPSGHTTQAFIGATFLHKEYGHLSPWYSVGGYAVAASVGALRIMNDKHFLSDVLFGAGIGILVTNVAYLTHRYRRTKKRQGLSMLPTYSQGVFGLAGMVQF